MPVKFPDFLGQLGATPSASPAGGFNLNPSPQAGTDAFGRVPGAIGIPDVAADLGGVYPNLSQTNSAISSNILAKLHGRLSPDTQRNLQDAAARFGVSSGMPGSGLVRNRTARDLGRSSEDLQQQGLQDYNSIIPTISGTQTVRPETKIGVAEGNAINASAPNPALAQSYAQQLFNQYLGALRGPGGGTRGNGGGPAGGTDDSLYQAARTHPTEPNVTAPVANSGYRFISPNANTNLMTQGMDPMSDWISAGGSPEDFDQLYNQVGNPEPAPLIGMNPWDYEYPE